MKKYKIEISIITKKDVDEELLNEECELIRKELVEGEMYEEFGLENVEVSWKKEEDVEEVE